MGHRLSISPVMNPKEMKQNHNSRGATDGKRSNFLPHADRRVNQNARIIYVDAVIHQPHKVLEEYDSLSEKLCQIPVVEANFDSRFMSEEFVANGRHAVQIEDEEEEEAKQANDLPSGPVLQEIIRNDEYDVPTTSVYSNSRNDILIAEQSEIGNSEYEREYGSRPAEKDDKLLIRLNRKRSRQASYDTEAVSDGKNIHNKKRKHRQLMPLDAMIQEVRKLCEESQSMQKRKSLIKRRQKRAAHKFVVTDNHEGKVVGNVADGEVKNIVDID